MPKQKYNIALTLKEQKKLKAIVSKGVSPARTIRRANLLLKYAACVNDNISISKFLDVVGLSKATLHKILNDYQERGIDCIYRKKRKTPPVEAKITGEVEAHLIALACHTPPEGYCKWTLRLLSERMVQMKYIDSISHTSVENVMKKNCLNPNRSFVRPFSVVDFVTT